MVDNGGNPAAFRIDDSIVKDAAADILKQGFSQNLTFNQVLLGLLNQLHADVELAFMSTSDEEYLYYCEEIAAIGYALSNLRRTFAPPSQPTPSEPSGKSVTVTINQTLGPEWDKIAKGE
jgi:hypothetical protein